jgi:hypothetical protein
MKARWIGALVLIAVALPAYAPQQKSAPASKQTGPTDDSLTKQVSQAMAQSGFAVQCNLRTAPWGGTVIKGWISTLFMVLPGMHPYMNDDEIELRIGQIVKAARLTSALHTEFAAPDPAGCATFARSHDLVELDAAAKLGLLFDEVNNH